MTWNIPDIQPLSGGRLARMNLDSIHILTDQGAIQFDIPAPQTARIAFTPLGAPEHLTWSLNGEPQVPPAAIATQDGNVLRLQTDHDLTVAVSLAPLAITVARGDGSVVVGDTLGFGRAPDGTLAWQSPLAADEIIYGGGLRTGRLDKRRRRLTLWNTDPLPDHDDATDAMYQSVPLVIGLRADGQAYGMFFDGNWKGLLDIGATETETLSFLTSGPDLVVYLFAGPTLADVLAQYTALTGRMPPVARWTLGNQQSRWSYMSADDMRGIAHQFREHQIPCDVLYADIDHMRGFRDFTWDPDRFPDPAGLLRDLRDLGMRLVPIVDPGVKADPDWEVYRAGLERGYYVRNPDGTTFLGYVWPGLTAWPDFTRSEVREWWGQLHQGHIEAGVGGIWDDMNEPTQADMMAPPGVTVPYGMSLPDDAQHGPLDHPIPHAAFHNAYATEMVRATAN